MGAEALAIETRGLVRAFGAYRAVDGIDLEVPRGCCYGFLGPNGAGKSTTIRCLTGLLRPTAGTLTILGLDPARSEVEVKRRVGVVPEDLALFERLTGAEMLSFVGRVHGLDRRELERRAGDLLDLMDLGAAADQLAGEYSHGMRKKLALAAALLPGPELLFLDEPFEGIDAVASRVIKDLLASFVARGGTVFLTSHVLEIVERLADVIGVIHQGRLVAQGPLKTLAADAGEGKTLERIFLDLVGAPSAAVSGLDWLGGRS